MSEQVTSQRAGVQSEAEAPASNGGPIDVTQKVLKKAGIRFGDRPK